MAAVDRLPIGIELERRDGWVIVRAAIPPRLCGLPNEACAARVQLSRLAGNEDSVAHSPSSDFLTASHGSPSSGFR